MVGLVIFGLLARLPADAPGFAAARAFLAHSFGFGPNAVHVILAVLVQLLLCALMRTPVSSLWPWIAIEMLVLARTIVTFEPAAWADHDVGYYTNLIGLALSLLLPTMLMLLARYFPRLFERRP